VSYEFNVFDESFVKAFFNVWHLHVKQSPFYPSSIQPDDG